MWRALAATGGDIVGFLDGDTADPDPRHLQGLLGPLLTDPSLSLVKGAFDRPLRVGTPIRRTRAGAPPSSWPGRRSTSRSQGSPGPPAAAVEFAGRRRMLEAIPFASGYGVEIGVLIDALRVCGLDALAECRLGTRHNRHQPLRVLREMSYAVLAAVENRLGERPRVVLADISVGGAMTRSPRCRSASGPRSARLRGPRHLDDHRLRVTQHRAVTIERTQRDQVVAWLEAGLTRVPARGAPTLDPREALLLPSLERRGLRTHARCARPRRFSACPRRGRTPTGRRPAS